MPASFSFGSKSTATNGSDKDDSKTTTIDTNGTNGSASSNIFQFGSQSKSTTSSIFGGTSTQNSFANASGKSKNLFYLENIMLHWTNFNSFSLRLNV